MSAQPTPPARVAVLISGRGSNMASLADAAARPGYPASIALVLSDTADAAGLALAAKRGLATGVVARADHPSRERFEAALTLALEAAAIDLVALAGFMRVLSPDFVARWEGRLLNIHPSLLPLFPGLDPHERALKAGVRLHGCTVHFVTAALDAGPIVAQAAVPVLTADTPGTLAARVLQAEHALYPQALALVATGHALFREGRTRFTDLRETEPAPLLAPAVSPASPDLQALARLTP